MMQVLVCLMACFLAVQSAQSLSDGCTNLPNGWTNDQITTEPILPVSQGTALSVRCKEGYTKQSGPDQITCSGINTYRSVSDIPICQPDCNATVTNGTLTTSAIVKFGETVRVKCDIDHIAIGENHITCTTNGNLSDTPLCKHIDDVEITDDVKKDIAARIKNDSINMTFEEVGTMSKLISEMVDKSDKPSINDTSELLSMISSFNDRTPSKELNKKGQNQSYVHTLTSSAKSLAEKIAATDQTYSKFGAFITGDSMAIEVAKTDQEGKNSFLSIGESEDGNLVGKDDNFTFKATLPAMYNRTVTGVHYKNDNLFPSDLVILGTLEEKYMSVAQLFATNDSEEVQELSMIATTVSDISYSGLNGQQTNLAENLTLEYVIKTVKLDVYRKTVITKTPKCSYYDEAVETWKQEGCTTVSKVDKENATSEVKCSCNHLTSFAVMMSFSNTSSTVEDLTSLILLITSLICLISTFIALFPLAFFSGSNIARKNRMKMRARTNRVHICFVSSLILAILMFLIMDQAAPVSASPEDDASPICLAIAFLMNYFWLCQLFWMMAEAALLYLAIVVVKGSLVKRPVLVFNLICWLVPAIFPGIGIGWGGKEFADPKTCFLRKPYAYVSFIGPIATGMITNLVVFLRVTHVILYKLQKNKDGDTMEQNMKMLKAVVSTSVILGIGWFLGFFLILNSTNFGEISAVLRWSFILFNSTQGIWIFVFYVLLNDDVKGYWMRKFGVSRRSSIATTITDTNFSTNL